MNVRHDKNKDLKSAQGDILKSVTGRTESGVNIHTTYGDAAPMNG